MRRQPPTAENRRTLQLSTTLKRGRAQRWVVLVGVVPGAPLLLGAGTTQEQPVECNLPQVDWLPLY
jgi:hypothetical protein